MRRLPIILSFLALLFACPSLHATNSDSVDVVRYTVYVDTLINTTLTKKLIGRTDIQLVSTVNSLSSITLDLLRYQIDSIHVNGQNAAFSYNDTLIALHPAPAPALGDTVDITVYYQGRGALDAGGFGGVYYVTNNVFNLGVGLTTDPHVYGRSWFPCKDNFTDRALFEFHIRADSAMSAICNGTLQSVTPSGGTMRTWHWKLRDPIPTYLASFSVSPYQHLDRDYVSITGDTIPYDIYAWAADTSLAKSQSQHLLTGINAFEQRFGAFSWERLGYVIVNQPTSGSVGAMEHATNIAYPRILLSQGLSYETIWAHEASHHWFGDLATCDDASDMWLNEGWASYCEAVFMEAQYGFASYKSYNRSTHAEVLRRAHIDDGGYWALSAMPTSETYGRTTYSKGAMVAHTLRGQLRDHRFFPAITHYLDTHRFTDVNTDSLRLTLERYTGRSLSNFFDSWVNQPGFVHVSLDSFYTIPGGLDHTYMFFRQRTKGGATLLSDSLVVPIRLLGANWERLDTNVVITGATDSVHIGWIFQVVDVAIDPEEWIADATTDNYQTIRSTGTKTFPNAYADLVVDSLIDSAWVQVTHNWVAPDPFWTPRPGIKLSDSRYWSVHGIFTTGFHSQAKFQYNGSTGITSGRLDNTWMTNGEDSLLLFYRVDAGQDWQAVPFTRNMGSPADLIGNLQALDLRPGDYCLGTYENFVGTRPAVADLPVRVYPNPNDGRFYLDLPSAHESYEVRLIAPDGALVAQLHVENQASVALEKAYLASGWYLVTVRDSAGRVGHERILIER